MPWNLNPNGATLCSAAPAPALTKPIQGFEYANRPAARLQFARMMAMQLLAAGAGFLTATGRRGRVQNDLRPTSHGSKLFTAVFDDGETVEYDGLNPIDAEPPPVAIDLDDDEDAFFAETEISHKYEIIFVKPVQES